MTASDLDEHQPQPAKTEHGYAWALAAVPLLMLLAFIAFPTVSAGWVVPLAGLAANVALCVQDEKALRAAGWKDAPHAFWSLIFVPVYLILRVRAVGAPLVLVAWVGSVLIYMAIAQTAQALG